MTRTCRLLWLVFAFAVLLGAPAIADDYLVYSDLGIPKDSTIFIWCFEDPSDRGLCQFFSERFNQCDNPDGSRHLNVPSNAWAGFGMFYVDDQAPPRNMLTEDLSAFADGEVRFFARSPSHELEAGFQCWTPGAAPECNLDSTNAGNPCTTDADCTGIDGACAPPAFGNVIFDVLTKYGSGPSADWQEIVIPIADLYGGGPGVPPSTCFGGLDDGLACTAAGECDSGVCDNQNFVACLERVSSPFTTTGAATPTLYQVDNIRWRNANSLAGASSVTVSGRQLLVDGKPFVVNGVAYSPQSIGENVAGGFRDRPELYAADFPAIAAMGANTIRVYSTFLTTAMLDAAWANGLYVIPTFGVDPVKFACDAGRAFQQQRLEEAIQQWKDHPAILAWMIGNEIAAGQAQADLCDTGTCSVSGAACANEGECTSGTCSFTTSQVCDPAGPNTCPQSPVVETCIPESCGKGWYSQLNALAAAAGGITSQPTATSNADVGNIGIPNCSDDAGLPNLDLWGMNLYRGCTFSNALSTYRNESGKPVIITEFGSDSWNTTLGASGAEDQAMQDGCVSSLLDEARASLAVSDPALGVSTGQIIFSWMDEWWKDNNDGGACSDTYWDKHDSCTTWSQGGYPDPNIQEEWWGLATRQTFCSDGTTPCTTDDDCPGAPGTCSVAGTSCRLDNECPGSCSVTPQACTVDSDCPGLCSGNPPSGCTNDNECAGPQICIFGNERCVYEACDQAACNVVLDDSVRVPRSAYDSVGASYRLDAVLDMRLANHDPVTGDVDVSFVPAPGSADHTLYYGPFNALSSAGYSGSLTGLGATGASSVTLPGGSLFWVVVGQNGVEGCYGKDSACNERPCFPDGVNCTVSQAANRSCNVPQCP